MRTNPLRRLRLLASAVSVLLLLGVAGCAPPPPTPIPGVGLVYKNSKGDYCLYSEDKDGKAHSTKVTDPGSLDLIKKEEKKVNITSYGSDQPYWEKERREREDLPPRTTALPPATPTAKPEPAKSKQPEEAKPAHSAPEKAKGTSSAAPMIPTWKLKPGEGNPDPGNAPDPILITTPEHRPPPPLPPPPVQTITTPEHPQPKPLPPGPVPENQPRHGAVEIKPSDKPGAPALPPKPLPPPASGAGAPKGECAVMIVKEWIPVYRNKETGELRTTCPVGQSFGKDGKWDQSQLNIRTGEFLGGSEFDQRFDNASKNGLLVTANGERSGPLAKSKDYDQRVDAAKNNTIYNPNVPEKVKQENRKEILDKYRDQIARQMGASAQAVAKDAARDAAREMGTGAHLPPPLPPPPPPPVRHGPP